MSVTWHLAGMTPVALAATVLLRDRSGIALGLDNAAEQSAGLIRGVGKPCTPAR